MHSYSSVFWCGMYIPIENDVVIQNAKRGVSQHFHVVSGVNETKDSVCSSSRVDAACAWCEPPFWPNSHRTRDTTRTQIWTFLFPLMLLACSVDTPIHTNMTICLRRVARRVPRPVWIGPKFSSRSEAGDRRNGYSGPCGISFCRTTTPPPALRVFSISAMQKDSKIWTNIAFLFKQTSHFYAKEHELLLRCTVECNSNWPSCKQTNRSTSTTSVFCHGITNRIRSNTQFGQEMDGASGPFVRPLISFQVCAGRKNANANSTIYLLPWRILKVLSANQNHARFCKRKADVFQHQKANFESRHFKLPDQTHLWRVCLQHTSPVRNLKYPR